LTYAYDAGGNRTTVGGTFARTGLPQALGSATFDAANRIATWSGQALSYDANGNLASDGLTSYTWNARNQLAGLSGATSAAFAYDARGQRRARTTSGTTSYLYDGANAAQELVGGTATANVLTGGIDEVFQRTDGSGTRAVLTDALGSTVALVDGSGAVQTQYTYEPFGATSTSGAGSANPAQFTGRENDGTGQYYYRARYYDPRLQRFLSEDPIGFAGGQINLYGYVADRPVDETDPQGTSLTPIHWWETYNAARAVGFSASDAWALAQAVGAADDGTQGTDARSANGHGMGGRKDNKNQQTCSEAYSGTADFIASSDLASALHAIEDSYVHGYAPWDGGSHGHWPGLAHAYNDSWYNDAAEAAAEAYLRSLGRALNPAAYQAPKPANCR